MVLLVSSLFTLIDKVKSILVKTDDTCKLTVFTDISERQIARYVTKSIIFVTSCPSLLESNTGHLSSSESLSVWPHLKAYTGVVVPLVGTFTRWSSQSGTKPKYIGVVSCKTMNQPSALDTAMLFSQNPSLRLSVLSVKRYYY